MATEIINLASYRQDHDQYRKQANGFDPAPDRLWEYLTRNLKINADDRLTSPGGKSL